MEKSEKKTKLKFSELPKHEVNPFAEKALEVITSSTKKKYTSLSGGDGKGLLIVEPLSGDLMGSTIFTTTELVDNEKFVKIFLNQIGLLWDLGKPAIKVFSYISTIIKPNKDTFIFRRDLCTQFLSYNSHKPVFEGLAELIHVGIIAKTKYDDEYYINPTMIFNGDRIVIAKEYKKTSKKTVNENQLLLEL
jgi:hypothetical protein